MIGSVTKRNGKIQNKIDTPWESIQTIGPSWGYNRMTPDSDYRSSRQVASMIWKVWNLGGRFLLNIGPDSKGIICERERKVLEELRRKILQSEKKNNVICLGKLRSQYRSAWKLHYPKFSRHT
jgi:alpha-L-fucosidase